MTSTKPPAPDLVGACQAIGAGFGQLVDVFTAATKVITDVFAEIYDSLARFFTAIQPLARQMVIDQHGPDNETQDGQWLSNMCAAWLHDSCPTTARSYCDCRCHA